MSSRRYPGLILIVAILLLLIAASRIFRFSGLTMNPDEVWSVWQTFGTPLQILQWTPYDWPPGYYLTLGLWRGLSGQFPIILRYLDVLVLLIGISSLFRVVKRLRGRDAALLAMPVYAAFGYGIILTTEVRGYALLMGMLPPGFWLLVRYFDAPSVRRGLLSGMVLAAMMYVSVTTVGALLMLGIYTLVVYRKHVWRWWLPGMIFLGLTFPEIASKASLALARTSATRTSTQNMPPLPEALHYLYQAYAGYDLSFWVWTVVALMAAGLILYRRAALSRRTIGLLLWAVGGPLLMYILHPVLAFFSPRYAWWIMLGIALWVVWGLAYLPRRGIFALTALFAAIMFAPVPFQEYNLFAGSMSPLQDNFIWLKEHVMLGDVFVADPGISCGSPEEWDYMLRTYFPMGLQFVNNADGYQRVWFITGTSKPDPELQEMVADGRISERFVGPAGCLFRLYEAPPDPTGILFENGMRFHGMDVMDGDRPWSAPLVRREGETVHIRLWWSVDRSPDLDYSVNTYVYSRNMSMVTEVNAPPQVYYPAGAPQETSRWQTGQLYVEARDLQLPYPSPKSTVGIYMTVYFWGDQKRIPAPGVNADTALFLRVLTVMAY